MSKSKGNVVSPDEYFESYGADALRMYLMFLGPYELGGDWRDEGIVGIARFLKRVWTLMEKSEARNSKYETNSNDKNSKLEKLTHKTIKKVTEDIENSQYNTAIAALMEYANVFAKQESVIGHWSLVILLKLLAPFAPHFTEELWREALGHKTSIHNESWPIYDPEKLTEEKVQMVVQVNGKVRAQIEVDADVSENSIKELALKHEKVTKWVEGPPKKIIVVPKRVVNIVV